MKNFLANYKNEMRKISSKKKFYVFLIIEAIICALWGLVSMALSRATTGIITSGFLLKGLSMTVLGFFIQVYVPLIVFMACSDLFASELSDGTIRASFMRPVSRAKQYFSKVCAVMTVAGVYLLTLFIITTLMQIIGAKTFAGAGTAFLSYLLDVVPMLVLVLFAAMANQFSGSTSLSMLICIIMYIGLYVVGIVVPQAGSLLFTGYMQWHKLWVGITIPFGTMLARMGMLAGYGMIFGCIGYYLYERREV